MPGIYCPLPSFNIAPLFLFNTNWYLRVDHPCVAITSSALRPSAVLVPWPPVTCPTKETLFYQQMQCVSDRSPAAKDHQCPGATLGAVKCFPSFRSAPFRSTFNGAKTHASPNGAAPPRRLLWLPETPGIKRSHTS